MSNKISRVKINELPSSESIHDEDAFIESSDSETYKTSADDIAKYISENKHMTEKYVQSDRIGESDGVAPCNAALYSRRKKHFIFDGINTVTALSFR